MKLVSYIDTDTDIVKVVLTQDSEEVSTEMTKAEYIKYVSGNND